MALNAKFKEEIFSIGDLIRVVQIIKEGDKKREQTFEGIVIAIKGGSGEKMFTVRKVGAQKIGIERIFPINSPSIKDVKVVKKGLRGVRRAKLYYIREKSKKEIERIYTRSKNKNERGK